MDLSPILSLPVTSIHVHKRKEDIDIGTTSNVLIIHTGSDKAHPLLNRAGAASPKGVIILAQSIVRDDRFLVNGIPQSSYLASPDDDFKVVTFEAIPHRKQGFVFEIILSNGDVIQFACDHGVAIAGNSTNRTGSHGILDTTKIHLIEGYDDEYGIMLFSPIDLL